MKTLKILDLSNVTLLRGKHTPDSQYCVMELAAYIAGEPWSDHPKCASPVITAFLVAWNDRMSDVDRQILKPYAVKVIGTRTTKKDETTRAYMAADWATRVCLPIVLRSVPKLAHHAIELEQSAPIIDAATAREILTKVRTVRAAAAAAAAAYAAAATADAAKQVQQSALELLDRMIAVGKRDVELAVELI